MGERKERTTKGYASLTTERLSLIDPDLKPGSQRLIWVRKEGSPGRGSKACLQYNQQEKLIVVLETSNVTITDYSGLEYSTNVDPY